MSAVIQQTEDGYYVDDMPNEEYHKPSMGVSTSDIKHFDPATYVWSKTAEKDPSKMKTLDFGTDFHAYFLEPEVFKESYKVLPVFNRRKADEKQAELDLIAEWKEKGIIAVTDEDMTKLEAMRKSALAHPTIAAIMAMDGIAERSYFWTDPLTGVECKCRPDWLVLDIDDSNRPPFMRKDQTTLVLDIKTIAQMDKLQSQVENLKYYVQDAFYTRGIEQVTRSKVCFVFGFVSTSLSLGRYPVKVVELEETAKFDGLEEVREGLVAYASLQNEDDSSWQTVIKLDRPSWATREEDIL